MRRFSCRYVFELGQCSEPNKPECMKGFQSAVCGAYAAHVDLPRTGMCTGEKRKATVPPKLGYAKKARPRDVAADERILFHIEMVDIDKN